MTGEMSRSEVTAEAYPFHFAVAKAHKGSVEPFDQYQGPFVYIPGRGRFWLTSEDGFVCYWYDERRHVRSAEFWAYDAKASKYEFKWLLKSNGFPIEDE